jgi:hypothetical protein
MTTSLRKPALLALGVLLFFSVAMLFVFLVTRAPAPEGTNAERADASGGAAPEVPPLASQGEPARSPPAVTREPEAVAAAPARAPESEPAPAPLLQGEPIAPVPDDPQERVKALAAIRARRQTKLLEQRGNRGRQ